MVRNKSLAMKSSNRKSDTPQRECSHIKKPRTQRMSRNSIQPSSPPPLPPIKRVENLLLKREEEEVEYDRVKFRNAKCAKLYEEVINHERVI